MGHMNNLRAGAPEYTDEAFEKLKQFTLGVAQIVVRGTSEEQRRRIEDLRSIPSALGGLGETPIWKSRSTDRRLLGAEPPPE